MTVTKTHYANQMHLLTEYSEVDLCNHLNSFR